MTNEEIERLYESETSRVVSECAAQTTTVDDYKTIDEAILKFGRELASRAYEEALVEAQQMLKCCTDYYGDSFPAHLKRFQEERLAAIRALKDELVQEPVASR